MDPEAAGALRSAKGHVEMLEDMIASGFDRLNSGTDLIDADTTSTWILMDMERLDDWTRRLRAAEIAALGSPPPPA